MAMPRTAEADGETTKVLELLQTVTTDGVVRQVEGYRWMESKVQRHFALLGFFLGALALGIPTAVDELLRILPASPILAYSFATVYMLLLCVAAFAAGFFLMALRWEVLWVDVISEGFYEEYAGSERGAVLAAMTKAMADAYEKNKPPLDRKNRFARRGYSATWGVFILSIIVTTLFVIARVAYPIH